jgi:glycosyltransferase involved in cell wall biosynthesis
MKIVIDARLYGLENAGLGRYVMNLIESLGKVDRVNDYVILLRKKYFDSVSLPNNFHKKLVDLPHYSLKEQIFLPLILYRLSPDLVHFTHFNVPILYFSKFVVTIHDLIMHRFTNQDTTTLPKFFHLIKRQGYKIIFWHAVRHSSNIIVPTNSVTKDVQIYYPNLNIDKIICTYEGISTVYKANNDNSSYINRYQLEKPYVVYFGNAYPHKNVEFLVDVVREINTQGVNLKLFLSTPRNVFTEKLKNYIQETGSEKYVIYPGFIEDQEMSEILKGSLCFVYPSLLEGFGLQGLEVLGSGTLLVASDISAFREVYQDKAIFFNPVVKESLIKAITKVLGFGENERNEWIRQGLMLVKQFSWDKMATETLKVYKGIH